MSSERVMAGPDWLAATVPVRTKTPVPTVAPMPMDMSDHALNACLRRSAPARSRACTGRTASSLLRTEDLAAGWAPPSVALYIEGLYSFIALDPGIALHNPCSAQAPGASIHGRPCDACVAPPARPPPPPAAAGRSPCAWSAAFVC